MTSITFPLFKYCVENELVCDTQRVGKTKWYTIRVIHTRGDGGWSAWQMVKMDGNEWIQRFFSFKDFIYLLLDRGEGREKEKEKHQCVVASHTPPTCALTGN